MSDTGARFRRMTVLAQDPTVTKRNGKPLLATVSVPAEDLLPGPRGHRVQVIDYDATTNTLYRPRTADLESDPWADHDKQTVEGLVNDPQFHQQNVYAIVMSTLAYFESSLGRNLEWAFPSKAPQIKIAPHGVAEANAFYSRRDEALIFGFFPSRRTQGRRRAGKTVFSCLSHDVVAHETTHAILDGLRPNYFRPSSADQAAFHEGFADLVAILSVFRLEPVVMQVLEGSGENGTISESKVSFDALSSSVLLTLADQMGSELTGGRAEALRASAKLEPAPDLLERDEFKAPHRRGEILVAATLHSLLKIWRKRLESLDRRGGSRRYDLGRVVEEGAKTAHHILSILIRALDYAPPVDLNFNDFLSAMLTADAEACPDDGKYGYRDTLRATFTAFGIPPSVKNPSSRGRWDPPPKPVTHDLTHFEALQRDPVEVFQFIWQNRRALDVEDSAFTFVESVRPLIRIGPDGFILRETVAEYIQTLDVQAGELGRYDLKKPDDMPDHWNLRLRGGGTLIFDEYGQLKFHIGTGVRSKKQGLRLASLWAYRHMEPSMRDSRRFASLHRARIRGGLAPRKEAW